MEFNTAGIGFTSDQSFRMIACPPSDVPTPTMQPSPTGMPTATPTGQVLAPADCVEPITSTQAARLGAVPGLAVELPTFEPLNWVTATVVITVDQALDVVSSTESLLGTPVAMMQTATVSYTWEGGQQLGAEWGGMIQPALEWLAVVNPTHPAYSLEGHPLWALAPVLVGLLPVILFSVVVVFVRFFFWILDWLRKLIELVFQVIELIPGE
jgi:hypothetical protein